MNDNEKKRVSIYVINRADQESDLLENDVFHPITCGSVFLKKDRNFLRDDIGENISKKRDSFCEFTTIYWVWKNRRTDYVGFCHYRRYLSFADKEYPVDGSGLVIEEFVSPELISKYSINDNEIISAVTKNDVVTARPIDLRKTTPTYKSLMDYCETRKEDFFLSDLRILREIIKERHPELVPFADDYYEQPLTHFYNCFIIKWDLFDNFCKFLFDVLFELEKRIDTKFYSEHRKRIIGFCGEQLYGIWLSYIKTKFQIKIEEKQLVFIKDTKKQPELFPAFPQNNIPMVVTCSDYYAPYLSVFISALMKNSSSSRNYDLIVLVKGISEESERRLKNHAANYSNLSLRFFNPKKMLSGMQFYVSGSVNAEEANYRLLTPWILKNYSKAIVTDIDLIFRTDPANLYEDTELENNCIACCKDVIYQGALNDPAIDALEYAKQTLKLEKPYDYVNTGVMLMNLDEIRKVFKLDELLEFSQKNHFRIQEQDILNVLFEGRILFLDISWNCYLLVNDWVKRELFFAPAASQKEYSEALKKAKVFHWASQPKPWASPELLSADNWWYYAKESPFYEVLIKRLSAPQVIPTQGKPSFARRLADVYLPSGSLRRKIAKKILPRNSKRWKLLKVIYYKYLNV